jgi:tetratricopeptide (TPR) repeat protein
MRNWFAIVSTILILGMILLPSCGHRGDDPAAGAAHMERGLASMGSGDFDKAMMDFAAAAKLMPDSAAPLAAMGDVFNAQGQPQAAIEQYRAALAREPGLAEVHFMIGFVSSHSLNDLATALAEYSKAAELDSTDAKYQFELGQVLHGLRRYDEAMERFRKVVAMKPDHPAAYYAIGELYDVRMGKPEEAFSWYEKAVALDPDDPQLRESVGMAYGKQGRYEDALRHLKEFVRLAPNSPDAKKVEQAITYIESQQGVTH